MWSSAVVVEDQIRLGDICVLNGFDASVEQRLSRVVVSDAPETGGSRLIDLSAVRAVLAREGVNMAAATLRGATRCAVARPSVSHPSGSTTGTSVPNSVLRRRRADVALRAVKPDLGDARTLSLRQAVVDYFDRDFARYGGRAEVVFDHTSDQVLNLTGPAYQFNVRRRGGSSLGLTQLEIDVLTDARVVQTVPLVAQVTMLRPTLVARRTVNQGATLGGSDVELVSMSFQRFDRLGLADPAEALGQRAKRLISAGTVIEPGLLEAVPLVVRGQIVKVVSVSSGIEVVIAGKAVREGLWGEMIEVRVGKRKGTAITARVIGPGTVEVGPNAQRALRGEAVARKGG